MAISGFYVGLYGVFKVLSAAFSSPKKEEVGERWREAGRPPGGVGISTAGILILCTSMYAPTL